LPVWIAVGGTPQSVVRAALLGLPLAIAIIGGQPEHFAPLARLYREAARRAGNDPTRLPVSINSHTYVSETSQQAGDEYYPTYAAMMNRIGRERGWSPMGRNQFETGRSPRGALYGADQRRYDAARESDARHRAVRHRGSPRRPQGDRAPIHLERRRTGRHLTHPGITPMASQECAATVQQPE
jgi:alkanesulfonate monooxygenase SsuD/methylene tetrahydromethanopterin reductase-like flavin-dependent oxidoreductase (luciferase family)